MGGCSDSILFRPRRAFQHELSNLQTAKLRMEPPVLPAWQVRTPEHCRETEKVVRMKMPHMLCMADGGIEIIGGWIKLDQLVIGFAVNHSYIHDVVSNQSAGGWVRFAFDALDLFCISQLRKGAMNGVPEVALQHMLDNMNTTIQLS